MLFISSLGIAYASNQYQVPEDFFGDKMLSISDGYSLSKYMAERLIDAYLFSTNLPSAILRVGQVAGPVQAFGVWPPREWFPSLLRASRYIGFLPSSLGSHNAVDWVPVDLLSRIIVEIAETVVSWSISPTPQIFNIVNPSIVPFGALLPVLAKVVAVPISCSDWVKEFGGKLAEKDRVLNIPGERLLGFYKRIFTMSNVRFEIATQNTRFASRTARDLPPVNPEWLCLWLQQWGYLPAEGSAKL